METVHAKAKKQQLDKKTMGGKVKLVIRLGLVFFVMEYFEDNHDRSEGEGVGPHKNTY